MSEAEWVEIGSVKEWAGNPRKNDRAVEPVAESIRRFGWGSPILVRRESGIIVAGHTRYKAAKKLGLDKILVRFLDIDENQAKALALADNRLGEIAKWDDAALTKVFAELSANRVDLKGLGWKESQLRAATGALLSVEGDAPDPLAGRVDSEMGKAYRLGPHTLVCGDCTNEAVVALLGQRPQLLLTDPPYCSGGFQESGRSGGSLGSLKTKSGGEFSDGIANDKLSTRGYTALIDRMLSAWRPARAYIFTDWRMWISLFDTMESGGLRVRSMIVWDKQTPGMGLGWRTQHELIAFGARESTGFGFIETGGNVIRSKGTGNQLHPTQKPVELLAEILRVSRGDQVVGDAFSGSGTTLIAAAEAGRIFVGTEIDPRFCDVIRRRWTRWAKDHDQDPGEGALE